MRFMVLLKADKTTEAGVLASEKQLAEMGKYNEELAKAGVLLSGEGLQPSSEGARAIHFEIHASDPEALIGFYTALLGWSLVPRRQHPWSATARRKGRVAGRRSLNATRGSDE